MEDVLAAIYGFVVGKALPFILLIGLLILVHEAGHFTLAKLFKIHVERFSIGFGPRIFGWTWGGTEYRIAWIPLGGYVKMRGDDPSQLDEARETEGSFLGAAVWKRILVVLAGPGVNLILPIFVLAVAASLGHPVRTSYIGNVVIGSPAEAAGILPGDRIIEINSIPITKWDELTATIGKSDPGEPIKVSIERVNEGRLDLTMKTMQIDDKDLYGTKIRRPIIGISHAGVAAVVEVEEGSAAAAAGFEDGDHIISANGQKIVIWEDLERWIATADAEEMATFVVRRPVEPAWHQIKPPPDSETELRLAVYGNGVDPRQQMSSDDRLAMVGLARGDVIVASVAQESPAESAGIQLGDRIIEFDGHPIPAGSEFSRLVSEISLKDVEVAQGTTLESLPITVLRDGETVELTIEPELRRGDGFLASKDPRPWLGVGFVRGGSGPGHWQYRPSDSDTVHVRTAGFFPALAAGAKGTATSIGRFGELAKRLVSGRASVRDNLGGPIAIGYVAGLAVRGGLVAFLLTIAELSIVLGVMNLLPIPVLDGGHLFFFATEAVMGRPPSIRVREVAQQVGLVLLLALMVFVMFNDVTRFF